MSLCLNGVGAKQAGHTFLEFLATDLHKPSIYLSTNTSINSVHEFSQIGLHFVFICVIRGYYYLFNLEFLTTSCPLSDTSNLPAATTRKRLRRFKYQCSTSLVTLLSRFHCASKTINQKRLLCLNQNFFLGSLPCY